MRRRSLLILLAIPLLALTTACAAITDLIERESPPAAVDEATQGTDENTNSIGDPADADPSNPADEIEFTGLSAKTTSGQIWAEPLLDTRTATILMSVAQMSDHVYFEVPHNDGSARFMGHFVGKAFLVRAAVCPNCGEESVEWGPEVLTCGSCGTTFDPITGVAQNEGRSYPEGWIMNTLFSGTIVMVLDDLQVAYERTAAGEERLFEGLRDTPSDARRCSTCG